MPFKPQYPGQRCSLGSAVADWLEEFCCHGPGDLMGEELVLDNEWLQFLDKAYELNPQTGRRIVTEAMLSRAKGRAKSELAGLIGVAEALGDVRFDGWDAAGQPVGRPVRSPFLKCLATEEGQAGNTFEVIAFIAAEWGPDMHPEVFGGISGVRIFQKAKQIWLPQGGSILAVTSGAASKDGGKETWVCADETHLYVTAELHSVFRTIRRNLTKRSQHAEPWLLQTTTMYEPGEQSIAEQTVVAYKRRELGRRQGFLMDHREASGPIRLDDRDHTMKQLEEAYGDAAGWRGLEQVYTDMRDPRICKSDSEAARYFLNRALASGNLWLDPEIWKRQKQEDAVLAGSAITLGFDGSISDDATVLIGCRMSDGFLFPVGIWAKPVGVESAWWTVDALEVDSVVEEAFERYDVVRLYGDPHEWRSNLGRWAELYGPDRVFEWPTNKHDRMAAALDRLRVDLINGEVFQSGDELMEEHIGNCYARNYGKYKLVRKEHPESQRKIDSVVGSALAYEARWDALKEGWSEQRKGSKLTRVRGNVRGSSSQ